MSYVEYKPPPWAPACVVRVLVDGVEWCSACSILPTYDRVLLARGIYPRLEPNDGPLFVAELEGYVRGVHFSMLEMWGARNL